jgi:hypothetical protein
MMHVSISWIIPTEVYYPELIGHVECHLRPYVEVVAAMLPQKGWGGITFSVEKWSDARGALNWVRHNLEKYWMAGSFSISIEGVALEGYLENVLDERDRYKMAIAAAIRVIKGSRFQVPSSALKKVRKDLEAAL